MAWIKKLKTKIFDSADILKKKLGCYLTYLACKKYEYVRIFAKTLPLHHWVTIWKYYENL